jgi:MATE family multidrug resistance protein
LENIGLAWPLIIAQLAGVGMGAVDTAFAGRLGAQSLAAVAVGVNLSMLFFVPTMGVLMALSSLTANLRGAGHSAADIGAFLRKGRRFGIFVGIAWGVMLNLVAPPALRALALAPETTQLAIRFVHFWSPSAIGFSCYFALRFGAEGLGQTRPILIAGLAGLAANTVLDWLLVLGNAGFPQLGAIGCGVATSISSLMMALLLAGLYRVNPVLRAVLPRGGHAPAGVVQILKLGIPISAVMLAEAGLFVLTALLMARFGETTVASYQIAINISALAFMIPVGLAQATTVRVGLAMGAGEFAEARARGRIGMALGLINAASNSAIMILLADSIVAIYTRDSAIASRAAHFLWLAAAFQFFDGLQATANGALRGIKDTRLPMAITLVAYWGIGLPAALGLAFSAQLGPDGLWWGLTVGLGAAAVGLTLRFSRQSLRLLG